MRFLSIMRSGNLTFATLFISNLKILTIITKTNI